MEYNTNRIQDVNFSCVYFLLQDILNKIPLYKNKEYYLITVVADSDLTQELLKLLSSYRLNHGREFTYTYLQFDNFDYDKEYYITINENYEIFVEKAWHGTGYFRSEAEVAYIQEGCNYRIIDAVNRNYNDIIIFGFTEDCEE